MNAPERCATPALETAGSSGALTAIDLETRWTFVVAEAVARAHEKVEFRDRVTLAAARKELVLAGRKPDAAQLDYARRILAQPEDARRYHVHERVYARRALQLHESPDEVSVPLQAFRIGALGIAAIPFEVFTESGLEIKQKRALKPAFTMALAKGS